MADARYTKLVSEFQHVSHENEQMEKGFRELRIRHEEMKSVLEAYRKVRFSHQANISQKLTSLSNNQNEEAMKSSIATYEIDLKTYEERYQAIKDHAKNKLEE
jgi:biotin synthase-like enzyme